MIIFLQKIFIVFLKQNGDTKINFDFDSLGDNATESKKCIILIKEINTMEILIDKTNARNVIVRFNNWL